MTSSLLVVFLVSSVVSAQGQEFDSIDKPGQSGPAPIAPEISRVPLDPQVPSGGSLWPSQNRGTYYFEDRKARRVGDVVTVRIVENSRGSKNASTKTEKDSTLKASIASLFGITTDKMSVETETASKFDGSGSTSRSSQLNAVMAVRVTDVLPNGNLIIDGKREVLVNKERQYILIQGMIRPEDIGSNNTILSSYIADANISYTGTGVINDKQRPGWFVRFFDMIWPF